MNRWRHVQAWATDRIVPRTYVPDLDAHRKHDEAVLFAAHPATFHVWVGTADGQVCSFCGQIRDRAEPRPEAKAEDYPLFLTLPASGDVA